MMKAKRLLTIACYTMCVVCLITAVVLALLMIWSDMSFWWTWKVFASAVVMMTASVVTLSLLKFAGKDTSYEV